MALPVRPWVYEVTSAGGGTLIDFTLPRLADHELAVPYASFTAPVIARCAVAVNGVLVDVVFAGAGGSHSWWEQSGGKMLPENLQPGDHFVVTTTGPSVLRIQWEIRTIPSAT